MKAKMLVVGLTPDYFSSTVNAAVSTNQNAMRSTNMGASFITRSILSIFEADYLDITGSYNISDLRNRYDVCLISLASHLGPSRDVSILVSFVKRLDIRTVFLSGGLDAAQNGASAPSKSICELIEICSADNQWVGVRGAASSLYLYRQGLKRVVPIGCPTMYSKYSGPIKLPELSAPNEIAVPFHWSIVCCLLDELAEHCLIGQDCIDEELFLGEDGDRISRNIAKKTGGEQKVIKKLLQKSITQNGFFPASYDEWYQTIGTQKVLLSGRLHAAICGLTQGVPTVLTSWDMRTKEIIEYFKVPSATSDAVLRNGSLDIMRSADFDSFNERQSVVWGRWYEFLSMNNLVACNSGYDKACIKNLGLDMALRSDSELLETASFLQPESSFSYLEFLRRGYNFARHNVKRITGP